MTFLKVLYVTKILNFLVNSGGLCEVRLELSCCFQQLVTLRHMDKLRWLKKSFLLFLDLKLIKILEHGKSVYYMLNLLTTGL